MQPRQSLDVFPDRIRAGTEHSAIVYSRQNGCAIHNRHPGTPAPGARMVLNEGEIAIYTDCAPTAELNSPTTVVTPVYAQHPHGPRVVPTGLVLVRFRNDVSVEAQRSRIHDAGYEIAQILPYARSAAWLRGLSGSIAEALTRLSELERLPDVENVEPQMLAENVERPM